MTRAQTSNPRRLFAAMALAGMALAWLPRVAAQATSPPRPNIVFILVDNVGWGDFSVYGGTVPTPRIDSIANQGVRFNNYTVEAQCTPTRSAILTGRMPVRSGTTRVPLPGEGPSGLAPWEYTVAELFSDAGYATAAYGKWHLGEVAGRLPTDQGFDEWMGIKNTSDEAGYTSYKLFRDLGFPVPQYWESVKGQQAKPLGAFDKPTKAVFDEKIAQRAVAYIERQAKTKKPFFLYVSFTQIHPPMTVHPDFIGKSGGGQYADIVAEMDVRTGQVLDGIKAAGIEKNTIVVFSSDNATSPVPGAGGGSNGPWRGDFFNPPYEGSYRTGAMIRWPEKIGAGQVTEEMLTSVDWLPTLAGMVGESSRVPTDRPIDGVNAADFMLGKSKTTGRHSVLYFGLDGRLMSVKWHNFKVIFRKANGIEDPITDVQLPIVYDLLSDPGEKFNLWTQNMDMGWVLRPVLGEAFTFGQSVAKFPNVKTGEDFKGYSNH